MGKRLHRYTVHVTWTGNLGSGTSAYQDYARDHVIGSTGKPIIEGSADPAFMGDPARWNPEELLLASLSACHQLWYLDLCCRAGIVVTGYQDDAEGQMAEEAGGAGQFTSVILRPRITIATDADEALARALHDRAHAMCFIARSMNFPVRHEPTIFKA